jgi:hypothetical protein
MQFLARGVDLVMVKPFAVMMLGSYVPRPMATPKNAAKSHITTAVAITAMTAIMVRKIACLRAAISQMVTWQAE